MEYIKTQIKIPLSLWRRFRILSICKDKSIHDSIIAIIEKACKDADK